MFSEEERRPQIDSQQFVNSFVRESVGSYLDKNSFLVVSSAIGNTHEILFGEQLGSLYEDFDKAHDLPEEIRMTVNTFRLESDLATI